MDKRWYLGLLYHPKGYITLFSSQEFAITCDVEHAMQSMWDFRRIKIFSEIRIFRNLRVGGFVERGEHHGYFSCP